VKKLVTHCKSGADFRRKTVRELVVKEWGIRKIIAERAKSIAGFDESFLLVNQNVENVRIDPFDLFGAFDPL
jgi:hypothetical protein